MLNKTYILNRETNKIELHFTKEEYLNLSSELKSMLKSGYLFSRTAGAWVSRSTNNHYRAIEIAKKIGFTEGETVGERLSYAEQIERQVERAEARTERYEQYAVNAQIKGQNLQSELNKMHGDNTFFTQPNINTSKGRSFTNYREKLFNRYNKGFEEYRKSEYFLGKARTAEETANMSKFKDKTYLGNRIKECNSNIKQYEKNIVCAEENNRDDRVQYWLERCEYEIDKLAYLQNCLDELGGVVYSNENIKPGYLVKIRGIWYKVIKANKTTVEGQIIEGGAKGMVLKHNYYEVQDVKIPEGFKDSSNDLENPYKVNDILVSYNISGNRIIRAYQVLKVTPKGVTIQKINIDKENKPILNGFTLDKPMSKRIVKSKYSDFIGVYDDDWQLHKYSNLN